METYIRKNTGNFSTADGRSFSPLLDNMDYVRMLEEIAAGTSEVRDEAGDIVVID
jgi:hypothetical protein